MTAVTYHDFDTEAFNMDALGNRTGDQTLRDDGTVDFTVASATNRYSSVGGNSISHDDAGNMTVDKDGYQYTYDYENRVVRIEDVNDVDVATHDYDALGRRIRVIDKSADPDVTTLYYYNPEWQVLAEYNGSDALQRYYVYGNYIDEPLVMHRQSDDEDYYYAQDHLYSVVALIDDGGSVVERYEYDAYGTAHIMDVGYNTRTVSSYGNPYAFTGRRLDVLDNGNLLSQHSRFRTYDTYTARFLQHDPMGVDPAGGQNNQFGVLGQYGDGLNLYLYVRSNPLVAVDYLGTMSVRLYKNKALHWGILFGTEDIDFGPIDWDLPHELPWWSFPDMVTHWGISPYTAEDGSNNAYGPGAWAKYTQLYLEPKSFRTMRAGPKKGKKCCKLTLEDSRVCARYVSAQWNGKIYNIFFQNCRHFTTDVQDKCCLTLYKDGKTPNNFPPIQVLPL